MLLTGIIAAGMPFIHMRGARYAEHAASRGGFFFVWTLFAVGVTGGLLRHPLGARTVEPATGPAPVVQQLEQRPVARRRVIGPDLVLLATAAPSSIQGEVRANSSPLERISEGVN